MVAPDPHRTSKPRSTPGQRQWAVAGRSEATGAVPRRSAGRRPRNAGFGAWEGTRTPDLRITNALLYQLSYPGDATDQTT